MSFFLLALLAVPFAGTPRQELSMDGTWLGRLSAGTVELRIVFHIETTDGGAPSAILDSPDQGATGIPFDEVAIAGDTLRLRLTSAAASFEGRLVAADTLRGTWRQAGAAIALVLARVDTLEAPRRPQEPETPLPYRSMEITFENESDGVTLAGTLTLPDGEGPFPAAAFISGSGPQDRDETVFGHRPFFVLSDFLTRRGIATLRYDDRGVGGSGGDPNTATSLDFARDAAAAVEYLTRRPEVDGRQIGLIGHSEGGLIAPMVATADHPVAFLVLIAPPGIPGADVLVSQAAAIGEASGATEEQVSASREIQRRIVDLASADVSDTEKREELESSLGAFMDSPDMVAAQVNALMSPWMQFFLTHDPASVLSDVGIPVLAVLGSNDLQVVPDDNVPALRAALEQSDSEYEVNVLEGLNHMLQESATGLPTDYGRIEQTIAPAALQMIGNWIDRTLGR